MPPIRVMASLTRKSAPGGATGLSAALPVRAGAVGGPLAAVYAGEAPPVELPRFTCNNTIGSTLFFICSLSRVGYAAGQSGVPQFRQVHAVSGEHVN